jgi:hypothetical protein
MAGAWAVFVGVMFSAMPTDSANQAAAEQFETIPLIMAVMVGTFAALLCCYGVLEIVAGRFISQRRARAFTMVVGLPRVMFIPYGALLTILTLIVLDRRSVRHLYQPAAPASAQSVDLNPPAE